MGSPNAYSLQGSQLSVGYFTGVAAALGPFSYQDPHQSLTFQQNQLSIVVSDIGTLVTVTINQTLGVGSTSFTLLVPNVDLGENLGPIAIQTNGITTLHRVSLSGINAQTELYTVVPLAGTAWYKQLP